MEEEKKEQEVIENETEKPNEENNEKEDLQATILKIKEGYETKLAKQKEHYEKRLEERNKVINQLLLDDNANLPPKESIVEKINKRREAQQKKW